MPKFNMHANSAYFKSEDERIKFMKDIAVNPNISAIHRADDGGVFFDITMNKAQYREFMGDEEFFATQSWTMFPDEPITEEEKRYIQ